MRLLPIVRCSPLWRIIVIIATRLLLGVWLTGLMGCDQPNPEIRVGVVEALSGDEALVTTAVTNAVSLAAQQVNEAGGVVIGGQRYRIHLFIEDDQGTVEGAITAVRRLIYQQEVIAIIGPQRSSQVIPVSSIAEAARILLLTPTATNPAITIGKQYVFRLSFTDDCQGQKLADFAYHGLGLRKAAILYDAASIYQKTLVEVFISKFMAAGGQVAALENYTTDVTDYTSHLERIHDRQPALLFLPNYPVEVTKQVRQARQLGVTAVLLGSDSWSEIAFADLPELEGSYYSDHWYRENPAEVSRNFVQAYSRRYGDPPISDAALAYDAIGILLQAMREKGSVNPQIVRDGLVKLSGYQGVTGEISYHGNGDPVKPVYIQRIQNGQPVFYRQMK